MALDMNSFLETALWSTIDYDGTSLDENHTIFDVSQDFKDLAQKTLDEFWDKAKHLFTDEELEDNPIEHDLWLTIHRHGAGFWDGDYVNGDALTEIACTFSELEDSLRESL